MRRTHWLAGALATAALGLVTQAAQAALICAGCEYGAAGTFLGTYNPDQLDFGTFQHTDLGQEVGSGAEFEDYWVFDLNPGGSGSMSADFTMLTGISGFTGELYRDGGSTCAGDACSSVVLGTLVDSDHSLAAERRWEIVEMGLAAGRYIIRVTGTTNASSTSAYGGQLAFNTIAEPGTLALFGLGLVGMGLMRRYGVV